MQGCPLGLPLTFCGRLTDIAVLFSPNTSDFQRRRIREVLHIRAETRSERYLGLPVSVGKSKTEVFAYLKERVWQRIQGWKEKLLSKAGKQIMIKAIAQGSSHPSFCNGVFRHQKEICGQAQQHFIQLAAGRPSPPPRPAPSTLAAGAAPCRRRPASALPLPNGERSDLLPTDLAPTAAPAPVAAAGCLSRGALPPNP